MQHVVTVQIFLHTSLYYWQNCACKWPDSYIYLYLSTGLSPPTAYAAFPTPPAILSEAALYQPPLLAAPRPPQTTAHSPAHTLAYYPPHPHLYMNMNMNYTAYYPRLVHHELRLATRSVKRYHICLYFWVSLTSLFLTLLLLHLTHSLSSPPVSPSTVSYFAAPPGAVAAAVAAQSHPAASPVLSQPGALVRMQGLPYNTGVKDILSFFQGYQVSTSSTDIMVRWVFAAMQKLAENNILCVVVFYCSTMQLVLHVK